MSSKQIVNVSEDICFRLANVVSLHQLNEERRVMSEEFNTWVHSEALFGVMHTYLVLIS